MLGDLVAMFFCGFFFAAALMGILIVSVAYKDDEDYPSADDMDQMCLWYEEEYKNE